MKPLSILCALPILASAITPVSAATASGTFKYNDKSYTATTAVAWRQDPFLVVAVSDKPFDPERGKDGVYNESELLSHPSATLTITIDAERRELFGVRLYDHTGFGGDFRCQGPGLLTLTKSAPGTVAGTFKCEEYDVTFTAPILAAPKAP